MKEVEPVKGNPSKVISIFVEQAQNIINYNLVNLTHKYNDQLLESSIVTIGRTSDGFFVTSGNIIDSKDLGALVSIIDFLNSLGPAELKQHYKEVIKSDNLEDKGRGAGLGLIHMARKAKSPLEYSNYSINEIIRRYPEVGYRMALSIGESVLAQAILAIRERWDGSGYPYSLKGEQIPIIVRIISIP